MHHERREYAVRHPASVMTRAALIDDPGVGVKIAVKITVVCARSRPARSRGLALRMGREDTLTCPAGEVVTLDAIRVILRRGRAKAGEEDKCRCHEGKKYYTHFSLLHYFDIRCAQSRKRRMRYFTSGGSPLGDRGLYQRLRPRRGSSPAVAGRRHLGNFLLVKNVTQELRH
jgi:hypothetical protein